jgi:N6-adenosine-specific RNA methylase IME4
MTVDSILEMGATVKQRAASHAMLFLWVTWPFLNRAEEVAKAWGFRYSSDAWVWVKGTGNGFRGRMGLDIRWGRGHTTRKGTEVCLLFRRGAGIARASMGVGDVILSWPEGRHSRKPVEQYEKIEEFLGPGLRRIELFARPPARADNWEVWGNET